MITLKLAEFSWSDTEQMSMVGCYYYGYVLCHILGGTLAYRYGFKIILLISAVFGGILTILFPTVVRLNYTAGIIIRVILDWAKNLIDYSKLKKNFSISSWPCCVNLITTRDVFGNGTQILKTRYAGTQKKLRIAFFLRNAFGNIPDYN